MPERTLRAAPDSVFTTPLVVATLTRNLTIGARSHPPGAAAAGSDLASRPGPRLRRQGEPTFLRDGSACRRFWARKVPAPGQRRRRESNFRAIGRVGTGPMLDPPPGGSARPDSGWAVQRKRNVLAMAGRAPGQQRTLRTAEEAPCLMSGSSRPCGSD